MASSVLLRMIEEKGIKNYLCFKAYSMRAEPGDIKALPVPEGFKLRPCKVEETEYCASTWRYNITKAYEYFTALMSHFPSLCLADSDDRCISFELGTEYGTIGMLHTREEFRGRGLAKVLVSNFVQEFFKDHRPAVAWVEDYNEASLKMHEAMGFKKEFRLMNVVCMPPLDESEKSQWQIMYDLFSR